MKIIIVGNGKTGYHLAGQLSLDSHDVTVIDKYPSRLRSSQNNQDVITYTGDAVNADVLREAGVATADLLIAVTASDETNLLCCMIARELGADHTIARVRDPQILSGLSEIWRAVGLSLSVNPESAAATEIAHQLVLPAAVKVDFFAKGRVEMVEYTVPSDSHLCGIRLPQLTQKLKMQILVCVAVRDGAVLIPDGSYTIQPGDRLGIAGNTDEIAKFFRLIDPTRKKAKTVIIVGGSTIGYYLARLLETNNMRVCIVEKDKSKAEYLADALPHAEVTWGDGSDEEMLREEGLDKGDALVALTNVDQENIVISMSAQARGIPKVITKINHTQLSGIISKANIQNVITPHLITAEHVLRYVRALESSLGSNVEALSSIMDGKAEALEFKVNDAFPGRGVPLRVLKPKRGYLIACIIRGRQTIFPRGEDSIQSGDRVIVVTTHVGLNNLSEIMDS